MFGGETASGFSSELWQFHNLTWAPVISAAGPGPRAGASAAWDPSGGYLVVSGGENASGYLDDSWAYVQPLFESAATDQKSTDVGVSVALNATASGGVPPYTFYWQSTAGPSRTVSPSPEWNVSFPAAGTVVASATVTDAVREFVSASVTLVIEPLPAVAPASASLETDVGVPVGFRANSSGGVAPLVTFWRFGDGTVGGSGWVRHAYAASGTYSASATVRDALGLEGRSNVSITVHPLPAAELLANPSTSPPGIPVQFSATVSGGTGASSLEWSFGDGASGNGTAPSHAYALAGTYAVRVNVTDAVGGYTVESLTVNVSSAAPATSGGSDLLPGLAAIGVVTAIVLAIVAVRRYRSGRTPGPIESSGEPAPEPGEATYEEVPQPEEPSGSGEEHDEPEDRE